VAIAPSIKAVPNFYGNFVNC